MTEAFGSMEVDRPPAPLRAAIARDLTAIRPLPSPATRALAVAPLGLLLLIAAPLTFEFRVDVGRLGWFWSWGASASQLALGLAMVAAALREAVPGRSWSAWPLAAWLALPIAVVSVTTFASWALSPTLLRGSWWSISGLCFAGSLVSALPASVLASILAARAYPTRPFVAGTLLGLGAGMMADGGWRLFCDFSELDHVLTAHLGGVVASGAVGALVLAALGKRRSLRSRRRPRFAR